MAVSDPRENHSTFVRLWNAGDIDGLVGLYEKDAVCVAQGGQLVSGHDAIRAMFVESTSMGENQLELIALTEMGDIALERTRWTMRVPSEDGGTTEQSGLSTVVLRRGNDGLWRMIIDDPGIG